MTFRSSVFNKPFVGVMAALLLSLATNASAKARIFLLAGQSNMAGAGLYDKLTKAEKKAPARVKIWNKNQWQDLGPGVSANQGRFGPELAFGRAMRKAFPADEIYLIKTAAGGTSMFKHWHTKNGGGPMLKRFLSRARAAFKNLEENNIKSTIDGMLWMQGESDAAQGMGAEYEASLRTFIKEMRREFQASEMPFILGRILPSFDKPKGNGPLVRAAQESVAKELKNVAWFDTDDIELYNKGHYNHNGQIELGNTFAQHFLSVVARSEVTNAGIVIVDKLSASRRAELNLPLKDQLTLATKADVAFAKKLTPDTVRAVKTFLKPTTKKIVISAARSEGRHLLLWISFPEVVDGGIDLIWSIENRKCVGAFLGGYRG